MQNKFILVMPLVIALAGVSLVAYSRPVFGVINTLISPNADAMRISDLQKVQNDLQLYFNRCGYYPGPDLAAPPAPCPPRSKTLNNWNTLTVALVDPGNGLGIASVPNDPVSNQNYFYETSADSEHYVLGAQLDDPANLTLQQAPAVPVYGIECSRTTGLYCVTK